MCSAVELSSRWWPGRRTCLVYSLVLLPVLVATQRAEQVPAPEGLRNHVLRGPGLADGHEAGIPKPLLVDDGKPELKPNNTRLDYGTPEGRTARSSLVIMYGIAMLLIILMWVYQRIFLSRYEKQVKDMQMLQTADRYLIKILNNFSVKRIDEYRFRGIRPTRLRVTIGFDSLSATVGGNRPCSRQAEKKTVLAGVTGTFVSGRMSAIMGPSGAGKTTFLNVLCGKTTSGSDWEVSGSVTINGRSASISELKPVMGFVPQDDVVNEGMTVRENIMFSAALRNPRGTPASRLRKITDDVLQVLQLEPQQNVVVGNRTRGGGLSGGQRKRVNVGMELAACPSLLFLDEPTSGLDATSSLMLVKQLKKMTQLGMTIVMVIHQPRYSLFTLLDDVLLLGKGGKTAFIGPAISAKGYLEHLGFTMPPNENPADWMMDVLSGQLEIPNPRIPKEELPDRLFAEWHERTTREPGSTHHILLRQGSGRDTSDNDDREVIKRHIKDEWNKVCPDGNPLGVEDFGKVLLGCTGQKADQSLIEELIIRMNGGRQVTSRTPWLPTRDEDNECLLVTQRQFQQYLFTFQGLVTRDAELNRVLTSMMEEEDDSSSSDDDEESSDDEMVTLKPRRLPGFFGQLILIIHSNSLLWWRKQTIRILFFLIVLFAAVFLGIFDRLIFDSPPWLPSTFMNAHISLGLLTSVYCLQCFSDDQPLYWRMASHGLNRPAFFIGRTFVDTMDWVLMGFLFTATYYIIVCPALEFDMYLVPYLCVGFVASGWGYVISCFLPPALGPFVSALLSFVLGGILGLPDKMGTFLDGKCLETVVSLCSFTRWSVPMSFFSFISRHPVANTTMDLKIRYQYDSAIEDYGKSHWRLDVQESSWWTGVLALMIAGFALRCLAFVGLVLVNRKKQV